VPRGRRARRDEDASFWLTILPRLPVAQRADSGRSRTRNPRALGGHPLTRGRTQIVPDRPNEPAGPSDETRIRGELLYRAIASGFADPKLATIKADELTRLLREVPIFAGLDERELRRLAERARVAQVTAGQVIVREGMSSEALYVLLTGAVRVTSDSGDEARLGRGSFFGEIGLLNRAPRSRTVTAERDLWLVTLPASELRALLDDEPGIARALLSALPERRSPAH
jgi:Cyclic nucleotide-binding domain